MGSIRDITDLILRAGDAQAQRAAVGGSVWGRTVMGLGDLAVQSYQQRQKDQQLAQEQKASDERMTLARNADARAKAGEARDASTFAQTEADRARAETVRQHVNTVQKVGAIGLARPEAQGPLWETMWSQLPPDEQAAVPREYPGNDAVQAYVRSALDPKTLAELLQPPKLTERDPTHDLVNPQTGAVVTPGTPATPKPPAVGSFEDYVTRKYGANPTPDQITTARKDYGQADDRPPINVYGAGANGNVPGDWNKTGADFLSTIPVQWRKTVEKIANYDEDPTKVASMRGGMRETLTQWVNQVNPDYRQDDFAIRNPTRKAFTTGTQGQQITALNTAIEHLDLLQGAADALQNGSFKPGNQFFNAWKDTFGSAAPSNFDTIKQMVDKEVEAVANKGIPTVSGTAEQKAIAGRAASPEVIKGYIDTTIPLMGSKLNALRYQYTQAMGERSPWKPLTPQAEAILAKRGFNASATAPDAASNSAPSAPKVGDERVVNGVPAVWTTINGQSGWKAK